MRKTALVLVLILTAIVAPAQTPAQAKDGNVEGTVVLRDTGAPLPNAKVLLSSRWYAPSSGLYFNVTTDAAGHFSMPNIPAGQYSLGVVHDLYLSPRDGYGYITVREGQSLKGLNLSMSSGSVIAGVLNNAAGKPVVGARLEAFATDTNGLSGTAATNDRGEFRISNIQPGKYIVRAGTTDSYARVFYPGVTDITKASVIDVTQTSQMNNANFVLQTGPLVKVSGQVVVDFAPANEAIESALYLFPEIAANAPDEYFSPKVSRGSSDPQTRVRNFEFVGLQPGPHNLLITARDAQNLTHTTIQRIVVEARDLAVGTIHLGVGVNVAAKIAAAGGGTAPSMTSLNCDLRPDARMALTLRANPVNTHQGKPDAAGNCTVPRMGDGSYYVALLGLPADTVLSDIRQDGKSTTQRSITIAGKSPAPLELVVSKSGTIEGKIRNAAGAGTLSRVYFLYDGTSPTASSRSELTDEDGFFLVPGFVPGDYTFFALEGADAPRGADAAVRGKYGAQAKKITIAPGSRMSLDSTPLPKGDRN